VGNLTKEEDITCKTARETGFSVGEGSENMSLDLKELIVQAIHLRFFLRPHIKSSVE
jgi:hypothetical protein